MRLTLELITKRPDGIFYELLVNGDRLCDALTHSYDLEPKTPPGDYVCVRGTHQLHNGIPFETFEVTEVPGHSGILFHKGNLEKDSSGCYLLGEMDTSNEVWRVVSSGVAFGRFMTATDGQDNIPLTVT